MKTVILQVTDYVLRLTPANKENNGYSFGKTDEFELPEKLKHGGALSDLTYFAGFVRNSMLNTEYQKGRIIFCLEGSQIVTKEYPHIHIDKFEDLLQVARLDAESVLHGDASNYVVTTSASGYKDNASGQEKNTLYAAPKLLIKNILHEFSKKKLNVIKIVPPITGLIYSCKTLLNISSENNEYKNKTVGVIDFSKDKSRLAVFCGGVPIFQKDFDSVYDEIMDLLEKSENMQREAAIKLTQENGFLLNYGSGRIGDNTLQRIKALINASTGEIMRSVRAVLGVKRLDIDRFILCGSIVSRQDFNEFIKNRLLGVPFENVALKPQGLNIMLDSHAEAGGANASDFFTLCGIISINGHDSIDFMYEHNDAKKIFFRYVYASIIIVVALAAAITVQTLIYKSAAKDIVNDNNTLSSNEIINIKSLLNSIDTLNSKNRQAENYKRDLPYQKSHSEQIFAQLQKQVFPHIVSMNTCKIDNDTGKVTLDFTTSDVDSFNSLRSSVEKNGYFKVIVPFTINKSANSGYSCSAVLLASDFTPLKINGVSSNTESEGDNS